MNLTSPAVLQGARTQQQQQHTTHNAPEYTHNLTFTTTHESTFPLPPITPTTWPLQPPPPFSTQIRDNLSYSFSCSPAYPFVPLTFTDVPLFTFYSWQAFVWLEVCSRSWMPTDTEIRSEGILILLFFNFFFLRRYDRNPTSNIPKKNWDYRRWKMNGNH